MCSVGRVVSPEAFRITRGEITAEILPTHGALISSLRYKGTELLWRRRGASTLDLGLDHLGPPGRRSLESFDRLFVGGWFVMAPSVGLPGSHDDYYLHGTACRSRWEIISSRADGVCLELNTPDGLMLRREIRIEDKQTLAVQTSVTSAIARFVTFGEHPCFDRKTFVGGKIIVNRSLRHCEVLAPLDPFGSTLTPGTYSWPFARAHSGRVADLSAIPQLADGRHDHIALVLEEGGVTVTAPSHGFRAIILSHDLPYWLLWENYDAPGDQFGEGTDVFALEPSNSPGRSVDDALDAGAFVPLPPGKEYKFEVRMTLDSL